MSKILEKPPIFISSIEEIKKIEPFVLKKQIFEFKCTHCGSIVDRSLKYLIKHQYTLMCKPCCQGFKTQQTKLERYGDQNYNNLEKCKQTCLARYGEENPQQNKKIKEKSIQTCLKKYGVENPSQVEEIKKKKEETCLKHYGVKNPTYIKDHIEKVNQTSLKKYKALFPSQNLEVKKKAENTCLEKYGFKSSAQNPEVKKKSLKETLSKRTDEEWREIRRKACKKYNYEGQTFDSSWELALWIYAKDHNEKIEREPCCFEYEYEEKNHKYFPDFRYKDQLIEIKSEYFFENYNPLKKMINPFDSSLNNLFEAKHQCGIKNGVQFWTFKEIMPYIKYIEEKHGKEYLEKFKNF